ncbi:hypothetical protein [Convivina praedatoris]|uniref:hypothetical protein n=1 Tax=Convivina praedatoris TaxID=2880963 RepID=UPI00200DF497|nr:hypothetical protein [Convivina sp. LMG 32447]CAH1855100.1 hypothetical protein R078138_01059 [Convivina sp. LMG 32447]
MPDKNTFVTTDDVVALSSGLTFKSVSKIVNGVKFTFSRSGPLVIVTANGFATAETGNFSGLVPTGYRPESIAVLPVVGFGTSGAMLINNAGGTYMPQAVVAGNYFRSSGSYLTADPMPN